MNEIAIKERELPQEYYDTAWSFIEREYESLQYLCRRYARGDAELVDELMSDVVTLRMPGIMSTYKMGGRASLRTHVFANVKWYLFKQMGARDKRMTRFGTDYTIVGESASQDEPAILDSLAAEDQVQSILIGLPPYERSILTLYHLCHIGFHELSDILGVSYGTARKHYRAALATARGLADQSAWTNFLSRCSISNALCVEAPPN